MFNKASMAPAIGILIVVKLASSKAYITFAPVTTKSPSSRSRKDIPSNLELGSSICTFKSSIASRSVFV